MKKDKYTCIFKDLHKCSCFFCDPLGLYHRDVKLKYTVGQNKDIGSSRGPDFDLNQFWHCVNPGSSKTFRPRTLVERNFFFLFWQSLPYDCTYWTCQCTPMHSQCIVGLVVLWWCVQYSSGPVLIVIEYHLAGQKIFIPNNISHSQGENIFM